MLTYRDQQPTTATREQETRNILNHATKHIPTILAQPDAGLHCKYPAFSSFSPAHWPQTRTQAQQQTWTITRMQRDKAKKKKERKSTGLEGGKAMMHGTSKRIIQLSPTCEENV